MRNKRRDFIKGETKEGQQIWLQIPENSFRILTIGGPRSGKSNSLFNLKLQQPDIDKNYLYAKDPINF